MTKNQERYRERRAKGLCVCCGVKATKSRCPSCMKDLTAATTKWRRERIKRLTERVAELEGLRDAF